MNLSELRCLRGTADFQMLIELSYPSVLSLLYQEVVLVLARAESSLLSSEMITPIQIASGIRSSNKSEEEELLSKWKSNP